MLWIMRVASRTRPKEGKFRCDSFAQDQCPGLFEQGYAFRLGSGEDVCGKLGACLRGEALGVKDIFHSNWDSI